MRRCIICNKPLSRYNPRDICFYHYVKKDDSKSRSMIPYPKMCGINMIAHMDMNYYRTMDWRIM